MERGKHHKKAHQQAGGGSTRGRTRSRGADSKQQMSRLRKQGHRYLSVRKPVGVTRDERVLTSTRASDVGALASEVAAASHSISSMPPSGSAT
jgi:hypothetical protein